MTRLSESTFSAFYEAHARGLWAYVYRVTGNGADADDVVQEAFLRLLRSGPDTADAEQQRRYLYRVASNLMIDRWRSGRRDAGDEPLDVMAAPARIEGDADVVKTFGALTPRERALLWLAYVEEGSHEEIAQSLGVARQSVKVLLFRARRRLRDLLTAKGLARTR